MLLAYAKLTLYSELLDGTVPDDPYLGRELNRYFPKEMAERFPDALHQHRLRREIIATQLTNSMINRGGATLIVRIADQTGASASAIAAAFAGVRNSYGMVELNAEIDALDNKVSGDVQLGLYAAVQDLLLDRLVWALRHVDPAQGLEKVIAHYKEGIAQVEAALGTALSKQAKCCPRRPRRRADQGGRAGDAGTAHRQPAGAESRARHRAGGGPRQEAGRRGGARPISPPRPSSSSTVSPARPATSWCRIISTVWRSTARSIRSAMRNAA